MGAASAGALSLMRRSATGSLAPEACSRCALYSSECTALSCWGHVLSAVDRLLCIPCHLAIITCAQAAIGASVQCLGTGSSAKLAGVVPVRACPLGAQQAVHIAACQLRVVPSPPHLPAAGQMHPCGQHLAQDHMLICPSFVVYNTRICQVALVG